MKRIAICDDHREFREVMSILIKSQIGLELAGSYPKCNTLLDDLDNIEADLVLLDINMPGIGGIDGLTLIKERAPGTKVIMLTIFDDDNSVMESMKRGADGYLLKKSSTDKIIEGINDVLTGGAAMTPSVAAQILRLFRGKPPIQTDYKLSIREKEILHLLVEGHNHKEIAIQLYISWETVRSHVKNIYEKMQVHSRTEAVKKALRETSRE